ncbi:MAG: hypothetical protein NC342_09360, partial [Pseudoflavonifractor sp.]|nr:hypothetical protein [Pseudoflavonifractor sp.]
TVAKAAYTATFGSETVTWTEGETPNPATVAVTFADNAAPAKDKITITATKQAAPTEGDSEAAQAEGDETPETPAETTQALSWAEGEGYNITIPADLAVGSWNVTLAAADDATFTLTATNSLTLTVSAKAEEPKEMTVSGTVSPASVEQGENITLNLSAENGTLADDATVSVTLTPAEGTATTITATKGDTDGTYTATVPADLSAGEYTVSATYTPAGEGAKAIDITLGESAPTITVTEEPTDTPIENVVFTTAADEAKVELAADATSGAVTLNGKVTPENATIKEGDKVTFEVTSAATGITVSFNPEEATIADDKTFTTTATVSVTEEATLPATINVVAKVGEKTSAALDITVTRKAAETPGDLPVEAPKTEDVPAGSEVKVETGDNGTQTVTIDFNATPVVEEGQEAPSILEVTLPSANEDATVVPADFTISYEEDGETTANSDIVTVTITAEGKVVVKATDKAKIGDEVTVTITKKAAATEPETPEVTPAAMLLSRADETADDPAKADENVVMTINVTIYGIDLTAPKNSITVNKAAAFAATVCVADEDAEAKWSVEGPATATIAKTATGADITFPAAGNYTVTVKAGNSEKSVKVTVKSQPTITGIEAVNADAAAGEATIYDLSGRRLMRVNAAGVYIVNGVKTLVK